MMNSTEVLAVTLGVIVIGPILFFLALRSFVQPVFAMTAGLVLALLSLTSLGVPGLRYALAIALVPHLASAAKCYRRGLGVNLPSFKIPLLYVFICFASIIWSLEPGKTLASAAAWLILLLFIFTFRSLLTAETIRRTIFFILLAFFVLSIAFLLLPDGWAGGRARGVFNNANSAGIYTFLLIGTSLWMGRKYWIWIIPASLIFIAATGSRAALLGSAVLLAIYFVSRIDRRFQIPSVIILVSISLPAGRWIWNWVQQLEVEGSSIFRVNNSRDSTWQVAFSFIREHPFLGAGYRATPPIIGSSSYIKLLAEFGLGFAFFGLLLIGAYIWWSRCDCIMLGITLGSLVNTVFEDWLLTAGAPMLAIYLLLVLSTPQKKVGTFAPGPFKKRQRPPGRSDEQQT